MTKTTQQEKSKKGTKTKPNKTRTRRSQRKKSHRQPFKLANLIEITKQVLSFKKPLYKHISYQSQGTFSYNSEQVICHNQPIIISRKLQTN